MMADDGPDLSFIKPKGPDLSFIKPSAGGGSYGELPAGTEVIGKPRAENVPEQRDRGDAGALPKEHQTVWGAVKQEFSDLVEGTRKQVMAPGDYAQGKISTEEAQGQAVGLGTNLALGMGGDVLAPRAAKPILGEAKPKAPAEAPPVKQTFEKMVEEARTEVHARQPTPDQSRVPLPDETKRAVSNATKSVQAALGAQRAPPEAPLPESPTQEHVNEQADRFNRLEGANNAAKIKAQQHVELIEKEAPQILKDPQLKKKFIAADEGDTHPSMQMTPQERALYDKYHAPLKPIERDLYQQILDLRKTGKEPVDVAEDDMNPEYAHRQLKEKTPAFDKYAIPERDAVTGRASDTGAGKLARSTSSQKARRYFVIERADGARKVVHIDDGKATIIEHGKPLETKPELTQDHDEFVPGAKVTVGEGGPEWTIKQAHTRELQEHTNHEYYETPTVSTLDNITRMQNVLNVHAELKRLFESPEWAKWASKVDKEHPKDWVTPKDVPLFKDYAMDPKLAEAIEDFMKSGNKDWFTRASQFAIRSLFWNPVPHMMNVGVHWYVARGWDWANPMSYGRLARTMVEAAHEVTTQGPKFLSLVKNGSSMMSVHPTVRAHYQNMMKASGELLEKDHAQMTKLEKILDLPPAQIIKAYYGGANRLMWHFSDILMMQRVLELENKGMSVREAIANAEKHIPNYRVPTRILKSRALQEKLTDPRWVEFGRYHYGMMNSYAHIAKDIVKGTAKERFEAVGNMLALATAVGVIYPTLDYMVQKATGNPTASWTRRGAATLAQAFMDTAAKLSGMTDSMWTPDPKDPREIAENLLSPSPMAKEGFEQLSGTDSFTGKPLSSEVGGRGAMQRVDHAAENAIQPIQAAVRAAKEAGGDALGTAKQFGVDALKNTLGVKVPSDKQLHGRAVGKKMQTKAAAKRRNAPNGPLEWLYDKAGGIVSDQ